MSEEKILLEISAISNKYDKHLKETGGYFNIFDIINKSHDEITICKVLTEILSPSGSHFKGNIFLKLFLSNVLKLSISDDEFETARVYREYQIDTNRRIDLVIETKERFIPIEVKIYAGEQENQCSDYYKKAKNSKLYYLTRFGDMPSQWSANSLSNENIECISFADDILNWLEICLKENAIIKTPPIKEILLQLIGVIKKFTGKISCTKEMKIKKLIASSADNMKSAVNIASSIKHANTDLIVKLFKSIENKVGKEKVRSTHDYEFNDYGGINKLSYGKRTYPSLNYTFKQGLKENVDLWVRLEIDYDYNIILGYCCPTNGEAKTIPFTYNELAIIIKLPPHIHGWWAYWEYCPNDNESDSPNFKDFNEAYCNLYDSEIFEIFTNKVAQRIVYLLSE